MKSSATAARAYAAQVLRLNADRVESLSVAKLRGGERHHMFKISELGGESYVVRINHTDDEYDREKTRREATVLGCLEEGLAPHLYHSDEYSTFFNRPAMLISFLPGVHLDLAASSEGMLNELGRTVGRLHDLKVDRFITAFGSKTQTPAEYLIGRFKWDIGRKVQWDKLPGGLAARFWKGYRKVAEVALDAVVQERWRTPIAFSLLHGDIGAQNVVWSEGKVRLLDWEDVRVGDAAEEVAYILAENALSDEGRLALWSGYIDARGDSSDAVAARVAAWEPIVLFGSAMWWLDRYARKLNARRSGGVSSVMVPRALAHYRAQALQRLRRFEIRFANNP